MASAQLATPVARAFDAFSRPDATALGSNWTGLYSGFSISSNQALANGWDGSVVRWRDDLESGDHFAQVTVRERHDVGVYTRLTGATWAASEWYSFRYYEDAAAWAVVRRQAAYESLIAVAPAPPPAFPYTVRLVAEGSTLTGYANGVKVIAVVDSALLHTGVGMFSNGQAGRADSFEAASRTASQDSFDLPDAATTGEQWLNLYGGFSVSGGQAVSSGAGAITRWRDSLDEKDHYARVTVIDKHDTGVYVRLAGHVYPDYEWYSFRYYANASAWALVRRQAHFEQLIAAVSAAPPAFPYTLTFVVRGSSLTGYLNDFPVVSTTDAALADTGVGIFSNAAAAKVDNFVAGGGLPPPLPPVSQPGDTVTFEDLKFSPYIGGPVPDAVHDALLDAIANYQGVNAPLEPFLWPLSLEGGVAQYAISTVDPNKFVIALWSEATGAHLIEPQLVDLYLSQNGVIWDQKPYDETVLQRAVRYWGYPSNEFRPFKPGIDCPAKANFQNNPNYQLPYPVNGCQHFVQYRNFLVDPLPGQELEDAKPLPHDICSIGQGTAEGLAECPARRHCPALTGPVTGPYCKTEDERDGAWSADRNGLPATCSSDWDNGWSSPGEGSCYPRTLRPVSGHATPKFMVLKVVYSPPGSNGCDNPSTVAYTASATNKTALDASKTFTWGRKTELSVGISGEASYGGASGMGGVTFTNGEESSDGFTTTRKVEVSTTNTAVTTRKGPCRDGIDHNEDGIQIALRPDVEIVAYEAGDCGNCSGENERTEMILSFSDQTVALTVSVGELRSLLSSENPADTIPMTAERQKYFTDAGISEADVMAILANDPFWSQGSQTAAPSIYRFIRIPAVLDYVPAATNTDPDPIPFGLSTNQTSNMTMNATHSYSTAASFAGSASFKTWLNLSLTEKQEETWTWTNSRASSQSTSTTNDANLSLGRPGVGYTGGTAVALYLDTIWKTFAFVIQ